MLSLLLCAGLFFVCGCGQSGSGPGEYSDEEAEAQLKELLERFPTPPPDTEEQIQQKKETVAAGLPEVYELLDAAEADASGIDEAVDLSMRLLAVLPEDRAAKVAYCRAQLASFLAKEVLEDDGRMRDEHHMAIAIRSACLEADRLRDTVTDLSAEEVGLCQDIYFHRARLEGFYPHGDSAADTFRESIDKLVALGFCDVERIRSEPRFEYYFADPRMAPVLEAALVRMLSQSESDGTTEPDGVSASES